jgi:transcriptional regulator with XRE-family HTH domain
MANLSRAAIACIEQGQKSPTLSTLEKLSSALDVSIAQLIGELPITKEDAE